MNLILIGYRGTGKSTVARELSDYLGMPRISLDEELSRRAGQTIPQIVESRGWDHFRDLEQALVAELTQLRGNILDCGGGVVERAPNITALRAAGTVFWLTASTEAIAQHISTSTDRPSLTSGLSFTEEIAIVLKRRQPLYAALAHVRIDTERSAPKDVARRILELWPVPISSEIP